MVYIFNTAGRGGSVFGNTLSLECDTSAMDSGDRLQITYDCADGDPIYGALVASAPPQATKITTSGLITYVATAAPGTAQSSAAWQVKKIDETSGMVITWADGDANFDNVATDLAALSYS